MYDLKVGAAKKCISPLPDMFPLPQQWMNGEAQYTGIRKDINVRAIVLDNGAKKMVFVIQEMADPMNAVELKEKIRETYGIEPESVFYAATHDHCVPLPARLAEEGQEDTKYTENDFKFAHYVLKQSVDAVGEALKSVRPAKYGYGTVNSYINVSREEPTPNGDFYIFGRNFEMPSDKTLAALKFEDYEGRLIAAILNYACHSTVSYRVKDEDSGLKIYGDLSGEVADFTERAYEKDNAVVVWTMAAAADQTPILTLFHEYLPDFKFNPGERYNQYLPPYIWKLCESLGQRQGVDAVKLLRSISCTRSVMKFGTEEKTLRLPMARVEGYDGFDERNNDPENFRIVDMPGEFIDIRLKLVILGNVAFFGMGTEATCMIGMRLKNDSPYKNLMIVTLWEDRAMSGYITDKKGYEMKTSTYYRNMVKDGIAEDEISAAMLEMYDSLLNK